MASSEGSGKSGTLSHFEYQECPKGLQEGDTTIMLRGLVRSINLDGFLKLLRNVTSNYDLVYVPVGNKRSTNLGLAFVNYSDPEGARTAFEQLYQARSPHTFRMAKRAYVQGLGPNLAFVLASGDAPLVHKHGIAVFQGGHRVKDVSSLVMRNVTDDMLAEAQVLMTRIQTEQKDQKEQRSTSNSSDRESSALSEGDVIECQPSTSGSSGRAIWFADRASATANDPIGHGMVVSSRNSFSHGSSSYSGKARGKGRGKAPLALLALLAPLGKASQTAPFQASPAPGIGSTTCLDTVEGKKHHRQSHFRIN